MRFIANILTDRKFNDCEFYNVVSKKEDLIENIPTLVIGWGFTKKLYPEANIINSKLEDSSPSSKTLKYLYLIFLIKLFNAILLNFFNVSS